MIVLKFGGTSVGNADIIKRVVEIIKNKLDHKQSIAVVVSAFHGVTDTLIKASEMAAAQEADYKKVFSTIVEKHISTTKSLIDKKRRIESLKFINDELLKLKEILYGVFLTKELTKKTLDFILSFGERFSAYLLTETLKSNKINAEFLDSRKLVITNSNFGNAKVNFKLTYKNINSYFAEHPALQIITGFIGSTINAETTTLGRGGSDFTASIIASVLNAKELEIWTDVDGVFTADPRKVVDAFALDHLTYAEAMELSHFGAKVIYPPTMLPVMKKNIPIRIKNTFNPNFEGSLIDRRRPKNQRIISGISSIDNIALLRIEGSGMVGVPGIAKKIFGALSRNEINIILITQSSSEHSLCLAIQTSESEKAILSLDDELKYEIKDGLIDTLIIEKDFSIIAIVGEKMRHKPGVAGRVFGTLGKHKINIAAIAQGASELNISVVISTEDTKKALNVLHSSFFFEKRKVIDLFCAGATGLVGTELMKLLQRNENFLLEKNQIKIQIKGIINSKKMILSDSNIKLNSWNNLLDNSSHPNDIKRFTDFIINSDSRNKIFIDSTSTDLFVTSYPYLLNNSVSIVTPNKIANSSGLSLYKSIRKAQISGDSFFLYETNVGASLPIISTLKDIINSGDKVTRFEGVYSGTLSYLLNTFDGMLPFSELVKRAMKKGFTEPDPRDDLSGLDVARKLLILIREVGYQITLNDIKVESLLPPGARNAKTIEDFFDEFSKMDDYFANRLITATKNNNVLRYIAKFDGRKAYIKMEEVPYSHPAAELVEAESLFMFYTEYYGKKPLVIRGPGAGGRLTASGVYADILKIISLIN
jgi:aspartokinase/homoserine dehydrogenase 1